MSSGLGESAARPENVEAPHGMSVDVARIGLERASIVCRRIESPCPFTDAEEIAPALVGKAIGGPSRLLGGGAPREHELDLFDDVGERSPADRDPDVVEPVHRHL